MQKLSLVTLSLVFVSIALIGCKDDVEEEQAHQTLRIKNGNVQYSLEGASLYFLHERTFTQSGTSILYRMYSISDGTLIPGTAGDGLNSYTGATYFMLIQLGTTNESLAIGDFVQHTDFDEEGIDNYSYFFFDTGTGNENVRFYTSYSELQPCTVTGGLEPGETLTVTYEGGMAYSRYSPSVNGFQASAANMQFHFEGTILDGRSSNN